MSKYQGIETISPSHYLLEDPDPFFCGHHPVGGVVFWTEHPGKPLDWVQMLQSHFQL